MAEPLLLDHHRPFLHEMLQELAQDNHGLVGIYDDALGDNVSVHQPLTVKKREHHLLGAASCHLGLYRAMLALLDPLFQLLLVSSIITILSNIDKERRFSAVTCSFFWS